MYPVSQSEQCWQSHSPHKECSTNPCSNSFWGSHLHPSSLSLKHSSWSCNKRWINNKRFNNIKVRQRETHLPVQYVAISCLKLSQLYLPPHKLSLNFGTGCSLPLILSYLVTQVEEFVMKTYKYPLCTYLMNLLWRHRDSQKPLRILLLKIKHQGLIIYSHFTTYQ